MAIDTTQPGIPKLQMSPIFDKKPMVPKMMGAEDPQILQRDQAIQKQMKKIR
jgi:hypothetical protein